MGDLGGGVKAQGSGDAGMAGQGQAGQTSQGWFAPGREPNSRSGAVTTVTLAIQIAAQIGSVRLKRAGLVAERNGRQPGRLETVRRRRRIMGRVPSRRPARPGAKAVV
jgi:hypothetical protein